MVNAVILLKVGVASVNEVAEALVQLRGVSEVFSVAGNYDLIALVRVSQNEDLADLVSANIRKLPGILSTETLIAFRVYSAAELETTFSMGVD
jgi:DNA-binding Lrp family transcriptional regulator